MEPEGVAPAGRFRRHRGLIAALAGMALGAGALVGVAPWSKARPVRTVAAPKPAATTTTAAPTTTTTVAPTTTTAPPTTSTTVAAIVAAPPAPAPVRVASGPPRTFGERLEHALGGMPGCLVVEQDGVVTFERNPVMSLVPASSQKLMVGIATLARLGPDFRFETKVVAATAPADGRLHDAWMVGAGDPYLATPDYIAYAASKPRLVTLPLTPLTSLADALVAAGVREIPGGLHGDESRYDTARSVPTWKPSYVQEAEVGSIGALTVNEGFASYGASQAVSPDPAADTLNALTALLQERGVAAAAPGPAPDGATSAPAGAVVVATVRSAPLAAIVGAMLRASDNYAAEMLLRELDRHTGGTGTTAGGAARVVTEMSQAGIGTEGVHLNDGSGLDLGNRSTCRALLGAVTLTARPELAPVAQGLAVAGRSGTLLNRFLGTAAEGRLAAKTGWLNGAAALVGRLDGVATRHFALVMNGNFNWATAKTIQDRVVEVLATVP